MGNYRQHITFAAALGVAYGWATFVLAGIHWLYGSVAALLTTLSGLLPDLDSDTGVELKGFTGILGVLVAVAVWQEMEGVEPPPAFEFQLWAVVGAYVLVRHGLRRALSRMARHRGISHSIPTCLVWGAATYLYYPSDRHLLRMMMAAAVMLGFFSHLLLDEICSVDLRGVARQQGVRLGDEALDLVPVVDPGHVRPAQLPVLARDPAMARRPLHARHADPLPRRAVPTPTRPDAPAAGSSSAAMTSDVDEAGRIGLALRPESRVTGWIVREIRGFARQPGKTRIIGPSEVARRPIGREASVLFRQGEPFDASACPNRLVHGDAPRARRGRHDPRPEPPAGQDGGPSRQGGDPPPAPARPAPAPAVLNQVLATVNGESITRGDLLKFLSGYEIPAGNEENIYRDAMETLVNNRLVNQFINRQKIPVPEQKIDEAVAKVEQDLKAEGRDLPTALAESNTSMADLRKEFATRERWIAYIKAKGTDAELKKFAEKNKDMINGTQIKASHIVLKVEPNATPEEKEKVRQTLLGIKQDIDVEQDDLRRGGEQAFRGPGQCRRGGRRPGLLRPQQRVHRGVHRRGVQA